MPTEERERTPVLFGVEAEPTDGDLKVLLDVVFKAVSLQRHFGRGLWYAASTGADIELRADGATIVSFTPPSSLTVEHTNTTTTETKRSFMLKPTIEASSPW